MKKYVGIFFILIYISITSGVHAHDNKVIHPFTITGKAMELLGMSTGGQIINNERRYDNSPYYELDTYFFDAMPAGYWKDTNGDGKIDNDEIDYSKIVDVSENLTKDGTFGTIAEDTEGSDLPTKFWKEIPKFSMFNHFYYTPKGTPLLEGSPSYDIMALYYDIKNFPIINPKDTLYRCA